jgi:hypothetical protein
VSSIQGSWNLISHRFEWSDGQGGFDVFGAGPQGRVILTATHMMVLITAADRKTPQDPLLSYSGRYRLEGDQLITSVDVAWLPAWVGTEQARGFVVDGDQLTLFTGEQTHPQHPGRTGRGLLKWVRETG